MYFDSHAHYDDERFDEDRYELIEKIHAEGVDYIVNAAADIPSCYTSLALAEKYPFVYCSIGVHPHDAKTLDDEKLEELKKLAQKNKVVAIGEIGLDYYYDASPREEQRKWFKAQLEMAKELNLPVIIHSREACQETFDIIMASGVKEGVIHCFSGSREYLDRDSLVVHRPRPDLSIAENFLYMLRADNKFTPLEAKILDVSLMLHTEHGGGNNSTFTTHVVTSSGTDTYASVVAALSSLKGPKHGGANIMVVKMFKELERSISDWEDNDEILAYLERILHKDAFDRSGVIYGMGHAIYSISDPRAQIFKRYVKDLSAEKGRTKEFEFYERVEKLSAELIAAERKIYKGVSANIDFYSGFVYSMLGIPMELYTPLFAIARISGWSAHRIEELNGKGKIIRPAYKSVQSKVKYHPIGERE